MNAYILHHEMYFGQGLPTFRSMRLDLLQSEFKRYGVKAQFLSYEALQDHAIDLNAIYLASGHQNPSVKAYILDILHAKFSGTEGLLYPKWDLIYAHDNKGFQGLLAKNLGIPLVSQQYRIEQKVSGPQKEVLKRIGGAGSGGVSLGNAPAFFYWKAAIAELAVGRLLHVVRAMCQACFKLGKYSQESWDYYRPRARYVSQKFIPGLEHDYKVLVFGSVVYVLKRRTRKGDFRASGSGMFDFVEPDYKLLDFSLRCRVLLGSPYVSLDVIEDDSGYQVIEYQCVHFGPYTQINAGHCYVYEGGEWRKIENTETLESLIVKSVVEMHNSVL